MTTTVIAIMFFGGIAAFVIGALVLTIMLVGRFALETTYAIARVKTPMPTLYEELVGFFSYALIAVGGVSTIIAAVAFIIKWLEKA